MNPPNRTGQDPLDDPRISAFAFDELSVEEQTEVAALLESDADARALAKSLRETGDLLRVGLANEPPLELTSAQRKRIQRASRPSMLRRREVVGALAAGLLVSVSVAMYASRFPTLRPSLRAPAAANSTDATDYDARDALLSMAYTEHGVTRSRTYVGPSDVVPAGDARPILHTLGYAQGEDAEDAYYDEAPAIEPNRFFRTTAEALSTFSTDVDTASYTAARDGLMIRRTLPVPATVRVEEFINYFRYDDPLPHGKVPFSVTTEVASAPWNQDHQLIRIGLKGRAIDMADRPPCNLVFLVDVSGSMREELAMLTRSMRLLVEQLDQRDRIAIVVYAGASGLALPSISADRKSEILSMLSRLRSGGSTNGGEGIELAYRVAEEHFIEGGVNRVLLASDGDFNVGITDRNDLIELIENKRRGGVFLSTLRFGRGNDATMEQLADHGNGSYHFIDSNGEAERVLVEQVGGTLIAIAKDVKIQVEFNPAAVRAWRLIGYENRLLANQDFADDTKDAGEIGAGISCVALYEVVPFYGSEPEGTVTSVQADSRPTPTSKTTFQNELMELRLRYKEPDRDVSELITTRISPSDRIWTQASTDFRFTMAVAGFAERLRNSPWVANFDYNDLYLLASAARGDDVGGYRTEFLDLLKRAQEIALRSDDRR